MSKIFFKKQHHLESLIFKFLNNIKKTKEHFSQALACFDADTSNNQFDFLATQTHKFESRADDIREEIKEIMYSKVLLPESREDIMQLLDEMDSVPNYFDIILNMLQDQQLGIPKLIRPDVDELVSYSLDACDLMLQQVEALFKTGKGIRDFVSKIDRMESQCDHIERRLIQKVFGSDLDPFIKIQLKEVIIFMGEISDQVDRVSRRVNIIRLKRLV